MKTFWTTLMTFLGSEGVNDSTLSFSCKKFKKNCRPISTSGECTRNKLLFEPGVTFERGGDT